MIRSLPYIGIARNGQDDRTTYVIQKGLEAIRSGASDEEVEKVVAKAERVSDKTIQMNKALR